jgi:hypothetical protein
VLSADRRDHKIVVAVQGITAVKYILTCIDCVPSYSPGHQLSDIHDQ